MADGMETPDGMALECQVCRWRPHGDIRVGLLSAHFETEHGTEDVRMELVVLCPLCDKAMKFDRSFGNRDHFACEPCHRVRVIRRG